MSCLFNSLAPAVNTTATNLRKNITAFLSTNPKLLDDISAKDLIKWTEGTSLTDYTRQMSRPNTWGGALEIKAFCELYTINVTIHVLYTGKKFTVECSRKAPKTMHINYNGSHFEPMYIEIQKMK